MADCGGCGAPVGGHAQSCDACGMPTAKTPLPLDLFLATAPPPDDEPVEREPRGIVPIILVAAVIIAAIVGGTIAVSGGPQRGVHADQTTLPTVEATGAVLVDDPPSFSTTEPVDAAVPTLTTTRPRTSARPSTSAARRSATPARTTSASSRPSSSSRPSAHPSSRPPSTRPTTRHTSPRPPPPGQASISRGVRYRGAGCVIRCYWIVVRLSGFSGGAHQVQCVAADTGAVFAAFAAGNGTSPTSCWYYRHRSVYVRVDAGIRSNTLAL